MKGLDWENLRTFNAPIIPQRNFYENVSVKKINNPELLGILRLVT